MSIERQFKRQLVAARRRAAERRPKLEVELAWLCFRADLESAKLLAAHIQDLAVAIMRLERYRARLRALSS